MKLKYYGWDVYYPTEHDSDCYRCVASRMGTAPIQEQECMNEGIVRVDDPKTIIGFDDGEVKEYINGEGELQTIFFRPKRWVRQTYTEDWSKRIWVDRPLNGIIFGTYRGNFDNV